MAGRNRQAGRQRLQGGIDGGSIHGCDDGRSGQMLQTQSIVKTTASMERGAKVWAWSTADGDRANVRGSQRDDRERMSSSNTTGTGGLGGVAVTGAEGGTRTPKARGEGGSHCSHRGGDPKCSGRLASPWRRGDD